MPLDIQAIQAILRVFASFLSLIPSSLICIFKNVDNFVSVKWKSGPVLSNKDKFY
jgi:hypothetical protein